MYPNQPLILLTPGLLLLSRGWETINRRCRTALHPRCNTPVDIICWRGAPLYLVEEVLHERILLFRIPGTSTLPGRTDGLWRPEQGAPGESAPHQRQSLHNLRYDDPQNLERAAVCVDPYNPGSPGIQRK